MDVMELYGQEKPVISMEFSPPRSEKAIENFDNLITKLAGFNPDYMSVTFGAGGSDRDGSYQTVKKILIDKNIPTIAYIAGFGLGPDEICEVLDKYKELGVKTIFVIRGDKPNDSEFTPHPDSFAYASDLISFIKGRYDFTLGCAGYPEAHVEAESLDKDIEYLKLKIDNGAQYVVVQYFYDNKYYFDYVEKCRKIGINIPIIPGIMPVYTIKLAKILSSVCGSSIVPDLQARLDSIDKDDKNAVLDIGIDFAYEQCKGLLAKGVPGLHFYTMGRSKSTGQIISKLKADNLL